MRLLHHVIPGLALGCLLAAAPAAAQFQLPDARISRSYSGQFTVKAPEVDRPSPEAVILAGKKEYVRLDPTILPVSCERIKHLVHTQLGITTPWQGKIRIAIYPATGPNDLAVVNSVRFSNGWQYEVELPNVIQRTRLVRALTAVLLQEYANRGSAVRSAELPLWLTEGMTQRLLASSELAIILPPPRVSSGAVRFDAEFQVSRPEDPLAAARKCLRAQPPFTYEQLSWPPENVLGGPQAELYSRCAQVFVTKLLDLSEGRESMRALLTALPVRENWQFAFLDAYHRQFEQPLDVEKWWALNLANFTGRDIAQTWPASESWQRLDEALRAPAEMRLGTNALPTRTEVPLATVLNEWERESRMEALRNRARDLNHLQMRMAPSLSGLTADYTQTIDNYLRNARSIGSWMPFRKEARMRRLTTDTLRELQSLEARRQALKPPTPGATASVNPEAEIRR